MFDESRLDNFASRSSSKWRRYPADVLPMHVAEMDFEVAPEIRDTLSDLVTRSDLGYLGPAPEVADALEGYALSTWGWQVDKSSLRMATDVGVAVVEILRAISSPGDKVLINSPVYSSFYHWIAEVRLELHDVPLVRTGETWHLDLEGIEDAFKQGVKIYLLCSPQNPVGRIHSPEELAQIAELAAKYDAVVIADEIHAPLSFEKFTPYLSIAGAELSGITVSSTSKAWNTAGLKAAYLVTGSEQVAKKLSALPDAMHWRSSLLGAFAMATAYQHCGYWIEKTNQRLIENLSFLREELARELPEVMVSDHRATYLAWLDLSAYSLSDPQAKILREGKVALVPGPDHAPGGQYSDFVRFNFATSKERIAEAVRRMKLAIQS